MKNSAIYDKYPSCLTYLVILFLPVFTPAPGHCSEGYIQCNSQQPHCPTHGDDARSRTCKSPFLAWSLSQRLNLYIYSQICLAYKIFQMYELTRCVLNHADEIFIMFYLNQVCMHVYVLLSRSKFLFL